VDGCRGLAAGPRLEQYEALFRENDIDAEVLSDLTDGDLEKIGVSLGHRKRLLKAIAVLAGPAAAPPAAAAPIPPVADAAERRPITVMFCDLVGSTSLAARLDAADWPHLVGAYLDEASAAVAGLGGHVLKKLGDGLMALFGYPHAQENDAERAVRAALAIQRALAELNARNVAAGVPELAARIGLDSGPVVVDGQAKCSARRRTSPHGYRAPPSRLDPHHGDGAAADRRVVCRRGPRRIRTQRHSGTGDALLHRSRETAGGRLRRVGGKHGGGRAFGDASPC
jgi:hypothetical protein